MGKREPGCNVLCSLNMPLRITFRHGRLETVVWKSNHCIPVTLEREVSIHIETLGERHAILKTVAENDLPCEGVQEGSGGRHRDG